MSTSCDRVWFMRTKYKRVRITNARTATSIFQKLVDAYSNQSAPMLVCLLILINFSYSFLHFPISNLHVKNYNYFNILYCLTFSFFSQHFSNENRPHTYII